MHLNPEKANRRARLETRRQATPDFWLNTSDFASSIRLSTSAPCATDVCQHDCHSAQDRSPRRVRRCTLVLVHSMFDLPPTLRAVRAATPYVRSCINPSKPCEPSRSQVQPKLPGIKPLSTNTEHVFAFCLITKISDPVTRIVATYRDERALLPPKLLTQEIQLVTCRSLASTRLVFKTSDLLRDLIPLNLHISSYLLGSNRCTTLSFTS
jgi:hypothetical protein